MAASKSLNASSTIDLDARRAQRREAAREPFSAKLGGETFWFPAVDEWPIAVTDHLKDGDLTGALRLLISEDDAERFFAQRPTMADVADLFEALGNQSGVGGLGNSSASARS